MFKRYVEVLQRLEELGSQIGILSNRNRQELQNLLEEQAWLSTTLVKQAKSQLEEIDQSLDSLFDWLSEVSNLIERAQEPGGTVEEILNLEKAMVEAGKLREQLKSMISLPRVTLEVPTVKVLDPKLKTRSEVAAALVPLEVTPVATVPLEVKPASKIQAQAIAPVKPGKTAKPISKKHKKKAILNGPTKVKNDYQPPHELLTSLAEKLAPLKKQYTD